MVFTHDPDKASQSFTVPKDKVIGRGNRVGWKGGIKGGVNKRVGDRVGDSASQSFSVPKDKVIGVIG